MNRRQISFLLCCGVLMVTAALPTSTGDTPPSSPTTNETTKSAGETSSSSSPASTVTSPRTTKATQRTSTTRPTRTSATTRAFSDCLFTKREGFIGLAVTGGLVVLCAVLLVCTVALSCQVCHMKRRYCISVGSRPTRSNIDLVSGAGYWGTGPRAKERPGSDAEVAETSQLMTELKQTREGEGRATSDQRKEKETPAKDTPKAEGGEAAVATGSGGSTSNGEAGPTKASSPSKEDLVLGSKQPAEPPVTTAASPTSAASCDAVVVVG